MPKCKNCYRSGFYLMLNKDGICKNCWIKSLFLKEDDVVYLKSDNDQSLQVERSYYEKKADKKFCKIYKILYNNDIWLPLTDEEIIRLSKIRKAMYIKKNFKFTRNEIVVNHTFRSRMNKDGKWYRISDPISEFPALATALLKHKQHEWILLGLSTDEKMEFMWMNKGNTSFSVDFRGDLETTILLAKEAKCNTVFMVHNHPNSYSLTPSSQDIISSKIFTDLFTENKLNFIDIVCARDNFKIFACNFIDDYVPELATVDSIRKLNGISPIKNWELRQELISMRNCSSITL